MGPINFGKCYAFEKAASIVPDKHQVERETVYSYWLKSIKELQDKAVSARNDKIITMHKEKQSTTIIAQTLALSDRHVRRIIREKSDF